MYKIFIIFSFLFLDLSFSDDERIHNQGVSCITCHGDGKRESDEELIRVGGTIFTTLDASNYTAGASSHKIKLVFSDGTSSILKIEDDNELIGNFFSSTAITKDFTAQVLSPSGTVVNSSSSTTHKASGFGDCNSCHTASGKNGAPGRIVNFSTIATGAHNQGLACLDCHSNNLDPDAPEFSMGVTLFTKLDAGNSTNDAASGYSMRIRSAQGETLDFTTGKGSGNFYANQGSLSLANYTVEILDSNRKVVNSSLSNSHDNTRFNCNSCHTASGENGANGRVVNAFSLSLTAIYDESAVTVPSFSTHIMPILNNRCKLCHATQSPAISDTNTTYGNINTLLLVNKTDGTLSHTGGALLKGTNWLETIKNWINSGANND